MHRRSDAQGSLHRRRIGRAAPDDIESRCSGFLQEKLGLFGLASVLLGCEGWRAVAEHVSMIPYVLSQQKTTGSTRLPSVCWLPCAPIHLTFDAHRTPFCVHEQGCWHLPVGNRDGWVCLDIPRGLRLGLDRLPDQQPLTPQADHLRGVPSDGPALSPLANGSGGPGDRAQMDETARVAGMDSNGFGAELREAKMRKVRCSKGLQQIESSSFGDASRSFTRR